MGAEARVPLGPLVICWLLTAGSLIARAALTAGSTPLILDTDDAMRLTLVHELLAGQGWFDHIQHRLNTPFGAEIHWSRVIDLPQAALLLMLRPVFGAHADVALAYIWPVLLLLPLLWLTARIAVRLGGRNAMWPALVLPAFALTTMAEFGPGRLDHHAVQMLLALIMLLSAIEAVDNRRAALIAGLAAGLALTIGIEALPMVAVTIAAMGLLWVARSDHAPTLRDFGLSFALTTLLGWVQTVPPDRWMTPGADAISLTYVIAALLCGGAFLLLPLLPLPRWPQRLVAGIVAGFAVVALVVVSYPPILGGPYGELDPWLLANWIDRISEAEPWFASFTGEPVYAVAVAIPVLTAILVALRRIVSRPEERTAWLIYLAFVLVALLVMALQIRAARIAVPLAVPAGAVLVGTAWRRMVSTNGVGPILVTLGSVMVSAGFIVAMLSMLALALFPGPAAAPFDIHRAERHSCLQPTAFADLAGLPPERIMTPIDLGSHMLLHTPHAVVAAPYHRNQEGVLDTFRFFNGPIAEAREILRARGISLVVICPAMREVRGLVDYTPDSFVARFAENRLPDWLDDVSPPDSALRVYSVEP